MILEDTSGARAAIASTVDRMGRDWFDALRVFDSERQKGSDLTAARTRLEDSWRRSIKSGHEEAFRSGYGSRGHIGAASLSARRIREIAPEIDDMIARQAEFAVQFAGQYASGALDRPGRMGVGPRSAMYSSALKAGFNLGAVSGGRPGEKIIWILGPCDHCVDCPALAVSGPYTRDRLPTHPGGGQTSCRTNCCCHLRFVPGPRDILPDAPDGQVGDFIYPNRVTPDGFEGLTASDVAILRDLDARQLFATRQIAALGAGAQRDDWVVKRRALRQQADAYSTERGVEWAPDFSPGDVITGADISSGDVEDIFDRGLDGATVAKADRSLIRRVGARIRKVLRSALDRLGIPNAVPVVPTTAAIIRVRDDADNVTTGFTQFTVGEQKATESKKKTDSVLEVKTPTVEDDWVVNLVTIGIRDAAELQLACLDRLAGRDAPYFVEIGAFDDPWFSIVSASGVWIRGGASEVQRLLAGLREDGAPRFAVAPLLT
jgi:hypothetical protein